MPILEQFKQLTLIFQVFVPRILQLFMGKKAHHPKASKSGLGLALTLLRVHSDLIAGHTEDE